MRQYPEVRTILLQIRNHIGRPTAVQIIREHGKAERLAEIAEELYDRVYEEAERVWNSYFPSSPEQAAALRLYRAAEDVQEKKRALNLAMEMVLSAKDDLNTAVDNAVAEMGKAGDFIRNHPAAANDPELRALADRLTAASTALSGVDVEAFVADPNA